MQALHVHEEAEGPKSSEYFEPAGGVGLGRLARLAATEGPWLVVGVKICAHSLRGVASPGARDGSTLGEG